MVEKALGLTKKVAPKAPGSAAEKLTATTAVTKADGAASGAGESDKPKAGEDAGEVSPVGQDHLRKGAEEIAKEVAHHAACEAVKQKLKQKTDADINCP